MKISIIPTGGLCNRMRVMATGIDIAQQYNSEVIIYWNNEPGLKADFSDLFKHVHIEGVTIIENRDWLYDIRNTKTYFVRWPLLRMKYDMVLFNYASSLIKDPQKEIHALIDTSKPKKLLIASCYELCSLRELTNIFVPVNKIQEKIDNIVRHFSPNTIGVHIRRTDNKESIALSPVMAFEHCMEEELSKDKDVTFYLASDDSDVKRYFKQKFPKNIITIFEDTSRNSLEGMQFAVVDLFCLSKTSHIIGSCYSSYSHIASVFGGITVEYATKNNRR